MQIPVKWWHADLCQIMTCRSSSSGDMQIFVKWWHADLRQVVACRSSSRHVVILSKGEQGPRIRLERSPAILPVAQSTVLHPGVTVASAGPGVPQILYAWAVTKHCCVVKSLINSKDASHLAPCPDQGQLKSQLGTSPGTGPHQELEVISIEVDKSPGRRPGSSSPFPGGARCRIRGTRGPTDPLRAGSD